MMIIIGLVYCYFIATLMLLLAFFFSILMFLRYTSTASNKYVLRNIQAPIYFQACYISTRFKQLVAFHVFLLFYWWFTFLAYTVFSTLPYKSGAHSNLSSYAYTNESVCFLQISKYCVLVVYVTKFITTHSWSLRLDKKNIVW